MRAVPPFTEQEEPRAQATELIVMEELASAELGMAEAVTARAGVEVGFVTAGTSQVGQEPEGAVKLVTEPELGQAPLVAVQAVLP